MERLAPPGVVTPFIVALLPEPVRVRAARRAVARLKHDKASRAARGGPDPVALLLLGGSLLCSAALGFVAGADGNAATVATGSGVAGVESGTDTLAGVATLPGGLPGIGAAHAAEVVVEALAVDAPTADPLWSELGRVRAEILRLRVLFRRLADVARLEDGEFDLELEPDDLPEVRGLLEARHALEELSIRALDPISNQSARMAHIFDERRGAHDRRVSGRVVEGAVRTSGFGHRVSPLGGQRQMHRGVDLAAREGTPIQALADGVVTWSGENGGYGNLVELEHGDGYRTRYAHNQSNLVALGDRVRKGEVVATLGSSGRSTGAHVHVEVRHRGAPLDPARFVR